jgi:hypothetical protein
MKLLSEKRSRLSLVVQLTDPSARKMPESIELTIKGHPAKPIWHNLGYWLFMDLPPGTKMLQWCGKGYKTGEQPVKSIESLPRLRPLVKVPLTPDTDLIPDPLKITLKKLGNGRVGKKYAPVTVTASGGCPPYVFSGRGLPNGMTLDQSGRISGTPTLEAKGTVTLIVTDNKGKEEEMDYTLNIGK